MNKVNCRYCGRPVVFATELACLLLLAPPPQPPKPCPQVVAEERVRLHELFGAEPTPENLEEIRDLLDEMIETQRRCGFRPVKRFTDDGDQKNPPQVTP